MTHNYKFYKYKTSIYNVYTFIKNVYTNTDSAIKIYNIIFKTYKKT